MLQGILVLLLFSLISLLDLPKLIKKKERRQIFVYSIILGIALVLSECQTFRIPVPSPDRLITDTVQLIFKW